MHSPIMTLSFVYMTASYPLLSHGNSGSSPLIHLDDVHCEGTENSLTECSHRGLGVYDCREGQDEAGVICTSVFCVRILFISLRTLR